ncbi:MFS transporter [Kutzneria sp. CA-103260]|uniref:MFS transporter n=1 Tax=Kutzneria sp. CA-103260 TaxID=2802641 RepID=UPI002012291F|nr:MFS transporter [Kutzneria sp. CA-103260]
MFGLTFALLLSDHMSRQALNVVFPLLKEEWALPDSRLAVLNSVVALVVGLLTFPLSLLADRWGRVRSLVLMAITWSAATLLCADASDYGQLLGGRVLTGVGEAAYGSVGIAVVLGVFPSHRRASLSGAFMAGGSFGSTIGLALGGAIAVHLGWRCSFAAMAIFGLLLAVLFWVFVTQAKVDRYQHGDTTATSGEATTIAGRRAPVSSLFSVAAVNCVYLGSGLQLFVAAVLLAWTPSFLNRYYAMPLDRAGALAAVFVLLTGAGMIVCGVITDRLSHERPTRKWTTAISYSLLAAALLIVGFTLDAGGLQLVLLGAGAFFSAGASGPATAMVAHLAHDSVRAAGFGALTLANNLLGMASGPFVVGVLADRLGLLAALRLAPLAYIGAVVALLIGKRCYPAGVSRLAQLELRLSVTPADAARSADGERLRR